MGGKEKRNQDGLGKAGCRQSRGEDQGGVPVVGEEGGVAAALVLAQGVDLALELGVGGDGAGLAGDLAPENILTLDATEQEADVVAGLAAVQDLLEHLHASHGGPHGRVLGGRKREMSMSLARESSS